MAVLGAGFAVPTLTGFLISVEHGLFGFKDAWSSQFVHQVFAIEAATIAFLGIDGALCLVGSASEKRAGPAPSDNLSAATG